MDPFDDTTLCYFAALIHGIRLINEKEADLGLPFGAIALDSDALVDFVRTKGDQLVHHMTMENDQKLTRAPHMRWLPDEFKLVLEESRKLCSDDPSALSREHLLKAQEILPANRRKTEFAANVVCYMRNSMRTGDGRKSSDEKVIRKQRVVQRVQRVQVHNNSTSSNGHSPEAPVVPVTLARNDDSAVDVVADQITALITSITIQALDRVAERLRK